MALKKTLAQRLFNITRSSAESLKNYRVSSSLLQNRMSQNPSKSNIAPDPGDNGIFRRFLHKRAMFQARISPELHSIPIGGNLMERLREMDFSRDRIRLNEVAPPSRSEMPAEMAGLTVEDARKLMRVAQMEMVKSRLREVENCWIPYKDYVRICGEGCSDPEQGSQLAKMLDESGNVIVFGNLVCLRPEQVTKAMAGLLPSREINPNDPRVKELEELKSQKAEIDRKADTLVRRELWGGLGYMVVQTIGFMRLTFWELSWDVMEPICFYVTSMYFMAGYAFFLRTSKEPSFEGFYQSRFDSKQRRLMKLHKFDADRYNELCRVIGVSDFHKNNLKI